MRGPQLSRPQVAGAPRRRKLGRRGSRLPRSLRPPCAGAVVLTTGSAMLAYGAHQNSAGVAEDNGSTAEHRISDEQAEYEREYWTDDRVREAVRNAKPDAPIAVEQD